MNTVQMHSILRRLFGYAKHKARTVASSGLVRVAWLRTYLRAGGNLVGRSRQRHGGRPGIKGIDGKRLGIHNQLPQAHQQVLRYDATGRIQQSLHPQGNPGLLEETFRYDQAANLLDESGVAANGSSGGYIRNNRLRVYQDKRYDWDGFGRMVCKRIGNHTTHRFSYDSEHRLVQADIETTKVQGGGSQTIWFEYDPLGRRTAKTSLAIGGTTAQPKRTQFQWDGMRLLQEEGGYTSSLYIYEDSEGYEPLAKIESDLRSLYPSTDANAAKVAQHPAIDTEAERPPQHITAANDQHYEDGWPISPQHTQAPNAPAVWSVSPHSSR